MSELSGRTWRTLDDIEKPIEEIDRDHARNILVHLARRGTVGAVPSHTIVDFRTNEREVYYFEIDPEFVDLLIQQIDNGPAPTVANQLGFWKRSWNKAAKAKGYPYRARLFRRPQATR